MRTLSLLSLIVALLIVAVLAKKQLGVTHQAAPVASVGPNGDMPHVDNVQQARPLQQQVQRDVNDMMQNRASQVERGQQAEQP